MLQLFIILKDEAVEIEAWDPYLVASEGKFNVVLLVSQP